MDTEVLYDDGVLRIDGHKIAYGPGNLLMRFLLEKRNDPGGRFSRVMQQLLGLSAKDLSQRDRLPETGSNRKWESGFRLARSVRPFLLGSEFYLPDPPFDWNSSDIEKDMRPGFILDKLGNASEIFDQYIKTPEAFSIERKKFMGYSFTLK